MITLKRAYDDANGTTSTATEAWTPRQVDESGVVDDERITSPLVMPFPV